MRIIDRPEPPAVLPLVFPCFASFFCFLLPQMGMLSSAVYVLSMNNFGEIRAVYRSARVVLNILMLAPSAIRKTLV